MHVFDGLTALKAPSQNQGERWVRMFFTSLSPQVAKHELHNKAIHSRTVAALNSILGVEVVGLLCECSTRREPWEEDSSKEREE